MSAGRSSWPTTELTVPPGGGSSESRALAWWRRWAVPVASAYAVLLLAVVFVFSSDPGRAALIVALLAVASGAFVWGLLTSVTRWSRHLRIACWVLLLLGALPLISFAFVLVPLVVSTAPAAFARGPAPRQRRPRRVASTAFQLGAAAFAILGLAAAVVIPHLGGELNPGGVPVATPTPVP